MLKIIALGLISAISATLLLILKFILYDPENGSTVSPIFATFDLFKDLAAIFMMLWYVLK